MAATAENGKEVTITRTTFSPKEEYVFSDEPFSPDEAEHVATGKLRLLSITECKVRSKPYSYIIMVDVIRERRENEVANDEIGLTMVYVISDRDGDGKFETMYPGDVDLSVPNWAIENK